MISLNDQKKSMFLRLLQLQWKSYRRSSAFTSGVVTSIFYLFGMLYFIGIFTLLGFGSFYVIDEDMGVDPLIFINKYMVYGTSFWVVWRYFIQKMPVLNVKALLSLPVKENTIVHYALGRTIFSFFNISNAFFFVPFSIVLVNNGYPITQVLSWHFAIIAIVFCTNYINILINDRNDVFYTVATVLILFAGLQYYDIFDITQHMGPVFDTFYNSPIYTIIPWLILILLYRSTFTHFKHRMYLDSGLQEVKKEAQNLQLGWLNRFGRTAIFVKNDIKLILRNKRSKMTIWVSIGFLFYGLLFFTDSSGGLYNAPVWKIFAGIFVTGGFLFTFGQYVPSWDSSYYPLMMSQNIVYREYLNAKWAMITIATLVSTVLGSFYIIFGWDVYAAILTGAIYNIGVNGHLVLLSGAYIKTPIDLTTTTKPFGDKQAFNAKTLLLSLPKLFLPMILYFIGSLFGGEWVGYMTVAFTGLLGFFLKNKVFNWIETLYKVEKHKTLEAYKQNS
ncbi:MAG: DUF5687 family protein [Flavobacteriaceae bacterium]